MKNNPKIRICAVTTISKTMDWFVVDSMRNLQKNGYDITLICNMDKDFIERNQDYATCIPVNMNRGTNLSNMLKSVVELFRIFKKEKFDVIYYSTPNASFCSSVAGKLAGIEKRIYSQCGLRYVSFGGIKRKTFKFFEKLTCKFSSHVKAQSPLNMKFATHEGLCEKEKISVVGIGGTTGVDLKLCDSFDHSVARKELREKYGIPQDAFVYGYVGRVNADKGINELIEAFDTIKIENKFLVLVGMVDTVNPIRQEIAQLANKSENIVFTGNVPPDCVYQHMAMFDVLVHPTYREGFGKVLQEAMGMSLPIITTDIIGPSEVIENGVSGILVGVKDFKDLSEKMELLYEDKELRETFAKNGRKRAEQYFDRPIMLKNILDDMNDIMGV